ncbi:response regulator [Nocardioides pyridinolyticus]
MTESVVDVGRKDLLRVYLLDDHELTRRGIRDLLQDAGGFEVVGESGLAEVAIREILQLRPDVAILDCRLPDGSGIEVCRVVRSADPAISALVLTSYDDDDALFAAIMAGASGYLMKQVRSDDFVDTVRRVAHGQSMLDPAVTAHVLERVRRGSPEPPVTGHLTSKEQQVLDLIGEGLTNRQIGSRLELAEKTVKNHVSGLLAKLGVESRTQAAIIATRQHDRPWT